MARQPRVDSVGAVHHVFMRGNARGLIAVDDVDQRRALALLEKAAVRFEIVFHAWCFLPNHAHLLVTSRLGNLSPAMHWLGTCSAVSFNRRHDRSGHLYQGRFGSKLVEEHAHLLELARYLPLNAVKAGLCGSPEDWPWSSYAATAGMRRAPWFLDSGLFIRSLGSPEEYAAWVARGVDPAVIDERGFRRPAAPPILSILLADGSDGAIAAARSHGYGQAEIALQLGVSQAQISRRLAAYAEERARRAR